MLRRDERRTGYIEERMKRDPSATCAGASRSEAKEKTGSLPSDDKFWALGEELAKIRWKVRWREEKMKRETHTQRRRMGHPERRREEAKKRREAGAIKAVACGGGEA
jgi:hypothetical protein